MLVQLQPDRPIFQRGVQINSRAARCIAKAAGAIPAISTISPVPPTNRQRFSALVWRRARCKSAWRIHFEYTFIGHEEDSNPRRSDRRDTRSNTGVPDHSTNIIGGQNRQACCCRLEAGQIVPSLVRLWGRTTGRRQSQSWLRSSIAEQPSLTRKVEGASPSGVTISWTQN